MYYKEFHSKLRNLKQHDSKEYWNILKKSTNQQIEGNISLQSYVVHVKVLGVKSGCVTDNVTFNPSSMFNIVSSYVYILLYVCMHT